MHPDLERLLELQAKDLELLGTDLRLKAVGEEIAGLDAALERARAEVEAARGRVAEGVKKRTDLETVIETQRTQQERRRSRIEQVRTAREVQALMTEMDLARSVLARQESDWVKAAETNQEQEAALQEAEQRLAALEQDQSGERARLEEAQRQLETEREVAPPARPPSPAGGRAGPPRGSAAAARARTGGRPPGPPAERRGRRAHAAHPVRPAVELPHHHRRRPAPGRRLRRLPHRGAAQPAKPDPRRDPHRRLRGLRRHPLPVQRRGMTLPLPRWVLEPAPDAAATRALSLALGVPEPLAALLAQRGIRDGIEARRFLKPELDALAAPSAP